jgi:predicted dehydrogenase
VELPPATALCAMNRLLSLPNMNKPYRVLVIGVGSIGHRHLRCFQATGRVTLSLCETNAALASEIAQKYGIGGVFSDLDAALVDQPDAAVIATPAHLHIPMAIKLASAGVHLLIEKPLSTSLNGVDTLQSLVQRNGIVAAVAYVLRAEPVLHEMRDAIVSGRFGRPLHVSVQCGAHFPTNRPAYRETYYTNRATGGGVLQDSTTHLLNAGQWLAGPIDRLVADMAHLSLDGVTVEDTCHILTRQGRVLGCYCENQYQAPDETTITVVCQRGTCRYEAHNMRWRWMISPGDNWVDEQRGPFERDVMFINQAQSFLDALEGRGELLCSLDEGLHTLRCNLAALASAEQGGWQSV